ncbi:MAG TPA: PAS domain-containing protein [Pseudobdellovibrionaceae bacterium]|jgi:aerotaxis receptor
MKSNQILENLESPFGLAELFISRTDERGVIQFGNDVFVRVSEFSKEELIGSPHNIIRHPHMPKAVFRLLWDTIKQGKIIAAYVKNRSATGKYYWVLATVFPVKGGYFSIRLKPTSGVLQVVEDIYKEVLKVENEKGIDAALAHMVQLVKKAGFENYESFQAYALKTELQLRDQSLIPTSGSQKTHCCDTSQTRGFCEMHQLVLVAAHGFAETVKSLEVFKDLKQKCGSESKVIARACERLENLAINMSISAHKLGKDGSTLAVVANTFQGTTKQIIQSYANFEKFSAAVLSKLEEVLFSISCSRVQTEMLAFFLKESIDGMSAGKISSEAEIRKLLSELRVIILAVKDLFMVSSQQQNQFYEILLRLRKDTTELSKVIVRLDLIKTGGMLEGSRSVDITSMFKHFLVEMGQLIGFINTPVNDILGALEASTGAFEKVILTIMHTEHVLGELELLQKNAVELLNATNMEAA